MSGMVSGAPSFFEHFAKRACPVLPKPRAKPRGKPKGWDSTAVSRMGLSEPHDTPFLLRISFTANTEIASQSCKNSPTVQHRKLLPSPETDPSSAAKPSSAAL